MMIIYRKHKFLLIFLATLPLKLLLTTMVQMHQEKDADKAAVKAEDKVKNWTGKSNF